MGALRMIQCEQSALLRPSSALGARGGLDEPWRRQSRRPATTAAAAAGGAAGPSLAAPQPPPPPPPSSPLTRAKPKGGGGALQGVPVVSPPEELLVSALKRASRVGPSPTAARAGGGEAAKERSRAARQLDALMKELSVPLGRYVAGFPPAPQHLMDGGESGGGSSSSSSGSSGSSVIGGSGSSSTNTLSPPAAPLRRSAVTGGGASLHPFDAALLDLTVAGGARGYAASLSRVDALRKSLQQTGKAFAGRAASAPNAAAAKALLEEGTSELSRLFQKGSGCVRDLGAAARRLRRLPQVDPTLPTVALVGAPNVGKSSLVRLLSSGAPTVCDYPFTTRSVALGHFFAPGPLLPAVDDDDEEEEGDYEEGEGEGVEAGAGQEQRRQRRERERRRRQQERPLRRHQVTDTPGLLDREDPERNAMERLTLACVAHLPGAAVLFVADLTEGCGASVAQQWRVRARLRGVFPGRAWVDVLSKGDLLEPWVDDGDGNGDVDDAAGGGGSGGDASLSSPSDAAAAAALEAAAARAERAVEDAEAPVGQRGGAREYERAVRLALACRRLREGGAGSGSSSSKPLSSSSGLTPALSPPLAVVRVSAVEGDLDGLKRAVLDAIAWAEVRDEDEVNLEA